MSRPETIGLAELLGVQLASWQSLVDSCGPDQLGYHHLVAALASIRAAEEVLRVAGDPFPGIPLDDVGAAKCAAIADVIEPRYRRAEHSPSCTGTIGKRWGAAYEGAYMALGGMLPEETKSKE